MRPRGFSRRASTGPGPGTRGANEIQFCWDQRDKSLGGKKDHERVPPPEGLPVEPIERKPKGGQKTLTSFFKKK